MNGDGTQHWHGLRVGAALIAAGCCLAGCGASSSGGAAAGTTPAALGTTAAASTPTTSSGGASTTSAGTDASSFCTFARTAQAQEENDSKAFTSDDPKQLAAYAAKAVSELDEFAATAPASIKPDVQTVVAGAKKVFTLLKNAGYDYHKVDPSAFASIDTPAFTKADAAIASYLADKCGINESGD
ncbi:MAG TPA: hypothetical protein VG899_16430 [Mycobacteriales bacterium]|nr:hypothetical protein [Mycobacteriales bacterium]